MLAAKVAVKEELGFRRAFSFFIGARIVDESCISVAL